MKATDKQRPSRLTEDDWRAARARWETDPVLTFSDLSRIFDGRVSKQAFAQRAKKESWAKRVEQSEIARRAHEKADIAHLAQIARAGDKASDDEKALVEVARKAPAPASPSSAQLDAAQEIAVDIRAQILAKHRAELDAIRGRARGALVQRNIEDAKLAKTAAETFKIVQDAERKAYGLDTQDEGDKGVVKVIIERGEG